MIKIFSYAFPCLISLAISTNVLAGDEDCHDASDVDCIVVTGTKSGEQLSAYDAAQKEAAQAALAAEQERIAEGQRRGYESMLRARAEAEAKAIADKQAAAEKAKHVQECKDLRLGIANEFKACATPKYDDFLFNIGQCPTATTTTTTSGSGEAGLSIAGNGGKVSGSTSNVVVSQTPESCHNKWNIIYGAGMGTCSSIQSSGLVNLPSYCK